VKRLSCHRSTRTCSARVWAVRRSALYLIIVAAGNLVWEAVQVPLYTIWSTGTTREIFVAVTHCTAVDVLIGTVTLLIGALVTRIRRWRPFGFRMMITTVVLGIAYTIFSEWLNVEVWNNWSYSAIMPVLPWFGTGLAPVLQWVIVPGLAFAISGMRKGDAA
jgi:hypothetical protein